MNIEAIYGVDAEGYNLLCILRARASRGGENGNVNVFQLGDVIYYLVLCQLGRFVLVTLATYYTCNLKVWSCFKSLYRKLTNVAVT